MHLKRITLFLTLLFLGCASNIEESVQTTIQAIRNQVAPDKRVALFDISASKKDGEIILTGETNLPEGIAVLEDSLQKHGIRYKNSIIVLPDTSLGGNIFAVVNNSVSNLRSAPKHSGELATQVLLGMPLKVLKKENSWYLVQTPEDYIAWVDGGGIQLMNSEQFENWKSDDKIIYLDVYGNAYSQSNKNADKVTDLVAGDILKLNGEKDGFFSVEYPDGRKAFIYKPEAKLFSDWVNSLNPTQETLVTTAKEFLGLPYLWGGTSTKGVDCSGFTKTIYLLNGVVIPRDASQQVYSGILVDSTRNFDVLLPGDLLFFGRPKNGDKPQKVVHVGMWIGNNEYIHSSEHVRINSMDPNAENFDEYNYNRYLETKRIFENWQGNIISVSKMFN